MACHPANHVSYFNWRIMTLSVAWLRAVGSVQELVFASDSRLRQGEAWDSCPKILSLPRTDCLISFAGSTATAYPLMLQLARAIEFYPASLSRRVDIREIKRHVLNVFNQMRSLIHDFPVGQAGAGDPEALFLFGGFSWREGSFAIWTLHYDGGIDRYTFRPTSPWAGQGDSIKLVAFAGDEIPDAQLRLRELLIARGKIASGGLDMEPFEVLRDMIRSGQYPTIGGAPQVAKVYRYMHTQHFGVRWPSDDGPAYALGRPALPYEHFDAPLIEPDRPWAHARQVREAIARKYDRTMALDEDGFDYDDD